MSQLTVDFGKKLYKIRKDRGITQNQLAEMIDVSQDFIGLMERGINGPSFKTLEKLSKALNIPVKEFFTD